MIEMTVSSLAVDTSKNSPFLVLSDSNSIRALMIWIGTAEAYAVSNAMQKKAEKKDNPHRLMLSSLELLGYRLARVIIDRKENESFSATLELIEDKLTKSPRRRAKTKRMQARAADAVVLATYANAPIMAELSILTLHAIPFNPDQEQEERAAFSRFVANIKASDFKIDKRIGA